MNFFCSEHSYFFFLGADIWDPYFSNRGLKQMLDTVDCLFELPFPRTPATTTAPSNFCELMQPLGCDGGWGYFQAPISGSRVKQGGKLNFQRTFSHYDDLLSIWCLECIVHCGEVSSVSL